MSQKYKIRANKIIPDNIPHLLECVAYHKAELKRLEADPNKDQAPFNPSQFVALAVILAEAKMGEILKKAGHDKYDAEPSPRTVHLPKGLSWREVDTFIKMFKYEDLIDEVFEDTVMSDDSITREDLLSKIRLTRNLEAGDR
jgi:hypothetical protein